ncbi:MAG: hypothetical protein WBA38_04085 [Gordonia sp. (in: high G+C Gram-positive bacteria)]|uniref:hypothetical protein n=1 Tax=Gordonia sp. (in: high G+C Gram-positive bacteria) TaxID=84139 RepID=UPI003C795F32
MTAPLIVPKSVITVGIGTLRTHFPGVVIRSRAPTGTWPKRFIRFSRIGGPKDYAIDRAFVLVECFASTEAGGRDSSQAEADALLAYTVLESTPNGIQYFTGGPIAELDDPDRETHARFQFTATVGILVAG